MLYEEDIAYLSGFFDGEGYIIICRDKASYRLRIGASQVAPEPIYLLKEYFGGLIQVSKKSLKNPKHRDIYTWQQHSQKASVALKMMLPYLRVKGGQASFAIEWAKINKSFQGKKKTNLDLEWLESQKNILSEMKGYL